MVATRDRPLAYRMKTTHIPRQRLARRCRAAHVRPRTLRPEIRRQVAAHHPCRQPRLARSDLDDRAADQGLRLPDLRPAPGGRPQLRAAAADGRRLDGRGRRPDLHIEPARGAEVPRQRAGALGRLHRLDPALGRARRLRPAHDEIHRRLRGDRRPPLQDQAQAGVSAAAGGARQVELLAMLHHARAHGQDRPDEAGHRDDRQRPLPLPQGGVGVGRQGGLGEVRRLHPAQGAGQRHLRRPHPGDRPDRMVVHQRCLDRDGRPSGRRAGLLGHALLRPAADPQGRPQHRGVDAQSDRQLLHAAAQPHAGAVQQSQGAPGVRHGDRPERVPEERGVRSGDDEAVLRLLRLRTRPIRARKAPASSRSRASTRRRRPSRRPATTASRW